MNRLEQALARVIKDVFGQEMPVEFTRPDEQFGDYATNVALQLAGQLHKNPRQVAEAIVDGAKQALGEQVSEIVVAGPGFINITLSGQALAEAAAQAPDFRLHTYDGQVIVTEFSDPNPFKVLHAGHLYTSVVGDALSRLFEAAGGEVHRVNFGGDVGMHVAKAMWGIVQELGGEQPDKLAAVPVQQRSEWLAQCYVRGNEAFETSEPAKAEITAINKRVYQLHAEQDHTSPFAQIYWTCRQWSYDYFEAFYKRLGTSFEKYYPESAVADLGIQTVRAQLQNGVYQESDGAIVFVGEPYGLHTRVFINSQGLPTYEAKDVGLFMHKWQDYHYDRSVMITGNDITEYMKVVLKSIEQFEPELVKRSNHLTHGNVKLPGAVKMSSRKGNVLLALDILDATAQANQTLTGKNDEQVTLAAVKYAFLKQRIGGDITYDPAESISLEGNSGPYLQYAHARARSILRKSDQTEKGRNLAAATVPPRISAEVEPESRSLETTGSKVGSRRVNGSEEAQWLPPNFEFQQGERTLARKISEYPEVLQKAVQELMPHHICTYLYELAQTFNRFYEHHRVIDDPRQNLRLHLVTLYANTLQAGLHLLGITAPDQM